MNEQLATFSTLLVYGTIASYVVAMVAFAADLSGFGKGAAADRPRRAVGIAMSTTWLGLAFHLGAVVLRGLAAGRVPWANMYEFTLMSTMFTVAVFVVINRRKDIRYLGLLVSFLSVIALFSAILLLYVAADGVQPALQSYWLVIHVSVATLATGLFGVAAALSVLQLLRSRDESRRVEHRDQRSEQDPDSLDQTDRGDAARRGGGPGGGVVTVDSAEARTEVRAETESVDLGVQEPEALPARDSFWSRLLNAFPHSDTLERLAYRLNAVGLVGWTFVLITGAIWAEYAWGRAWGWDPKEVITLVVWLIYAAYCHVRLTTGWDKRTFAYFSLAGFVALLFNYYGVNIFINSLHSYSGI